MVDIERWIDLHAADLHGIAERLGASDEFVELLATFILDGLDDDEIYAHLRAMTPSWDGQRSPLADAPELLGEVRQIVDAAEA
jgi:hypothetical protein